MSILFVIISFIKIKEMEMVVLKMKVKKLKKRVVWGFNPITRVVESKKIYKRSREKQKVRKEIREFF